MASATTASATAPSQPRVTWLSGPALDLLVGCGAWSLPLIALVYVIGSTRDATITLAFYSLTLVCNYPHYFATIYRAYRTRSELSKYRFFTVNVTVLLLLTAAFVHWSPRWAPLLFTIFITWSPWHYTGQNFGIAMMFARRNGAAPTRADRNWLYTAFVASYVTIFLALHTGASDEPYVLSLGLPMALSRVLGPMAMTVFAVAAVRGAIPIVRRVGLRRAGPTIAVLTTQFLWFVFPTLVVATVGAEVKRTSYSIGLLAFMHCAQYLWITRYYARREAVERGSRWRPWVYAATLVVGGIALFIPGPWLVSYAFRYDFTASFVIFSALVNIHHFALDGAIWKLRDGRIAAFLLGDKPADAVGGDTPWTEGWRLPARFALLAGLVAVVAIGVLDQVRFYLGADPSRPDRLASAARLNPFDVPLRTAIARAQDRAGQTDAAIATLRSAVAIDPYDAAAERALARLLLESGRLDEAYRQHAEMIKYVPSDVDVLVNYGTLAGQVGHDAEAIDAFTQALAIDDDQPLAHLRLAEALVREQRPRDAVIHYNTYVVQASAHHDALTDPKQFATVLLESGDAYAAIGQPEQAATYYEHAAEFAGQAGEASLEGGAYGRIAALLDAAGRPKEAALAYVRAIERDEAAGDVAAAATEWFNYAQLLAAQSAPPRLQIACLIKAGQAFRDRGDANADSVDAALKQAEARSPAEAAEARKSLDATLAAAKAFASRAE